MYPATVVRLGEQVRELGDFRANYLERVLTDILTLAIEREFQITVGTGYHNRNPGIAGGYDIELEHLRHIWFDIIKDVTPGRSGLISKLSNGKAPSGYHRELIEILGLRRPIGLDIHALRKVELLTEAHPEFPEDWDKSNGKWQPVTEPVLLCYRIADMRVRVFTGSRTAN